MSYPPIWTPELLLAAGIGEGEAICYRPRWPNATRHGIPVVECLPVWSISELRIGGLIAVGRTPDGIALFHEGRVGLHQKPCPTCPDWYRAADASVDGEAWAVQAIAEGLAQCGLLADFATRYRSTAGRVRSAQDTAARLAFAEALSAWPLGLAMDEWEGCFGYPISEPAAVVAVGRFIRGTA